MGLVVTATVGCRVRAKVILSYRKSALPYRCPCSRIAPTCLEGGEGHEMLSLSLLFCTSSSSRFRFTPAHEYNFRGAGPGIDWALLESSMDGLHTRPNS